MKTLKFLLSILLILSISNVFSQQGAVGILNKQVMADTLKMATIDSSRQQDIIDIVEKILDKTTSPDKRKFPKKFLLKKRFFKNRTPKENFK